MNRSIRTFIATGALCAGAFGAAGVATAAPDVYVALHPYPGSAPVYIHPEAPRHVYNERRMYNDRYAYNDERRDHRRAERCGAERWNPNVRYAPGDVVWRHGELYQARRISNQVYNENSPPEWTPNYWRPTRCR